MRLPALLWALLHAPVFLLLYRGPLGRALQPMAGGYGLGIVTAWTFEAIGLALFAFVLALPFSRRAAWYRFAAPAVAALLTVVFAADSRLYAALGFHVNSLIVRVLFQPGAFGQIGIPVGELLLNVAYAVLFVVLDVWAGSRFVVRFATARRAWPLAAALVAFPLADRLLVATMEFSGGPAAYAAGGVMPLQVPFRMNSFLARLTGRRQKVDETLALEARRGADRERLPVDSVRVTRRPDVVLVLIESLRADFLTPEIMPRLWARAEDGTRFTHHYASASATHYALFSLFYGLNSAKLERTIGAGRSPLLFGVLRHAGYRMRLITASSVDWMGLRQTVFKDVAGQLDTDLPGDAIGRDSAMVARARDFTAAADTAPVFRVLVFDGTHFNYVYRPDAERFTPAWDGRGSIEAASVEPALLAHRAMNAAWDVDRRLGEFLDWFVARRGRRPLLVVTGDHGEAFGEHGRVGHGAGVSEQEIHVPMVIVDDSMPRGVQDGVTSHVDVVPTILRLLGDTHDPQRWSDGAWMTAPPPGRFVLSTAGWVPRYAVIGPDLKAQFNGVNPGIGGVTITAPDGTPLPDARDRFRRDTGGILSALQRAR